MAAPNFLFEDVERLAALAKVASPATGIMLFDSNPPPSSGLFRGTGRIAGTVKVITTPAPSRTVRLYDRLTGTFVAEVASEPDGTYEFADINTARNFNVVAFDEDGGYDPVISVTVVPA
jgi:hypothetical protein